MDSLTIGIFAGLAILLGTFAVMHRRLPAHLLLEPRLRRLPSTPAIIDRVVSARRRQVLWSCLCGLCGLGAGFVIDFVEQSLSSPKPWTTGSSTFYLALFGFIAGAVINLARNGYAFAAPDGIRVAGTRRPTLRSLIGAPTLILAHLCVAIATTTTMWVLFSPGARETLVDPDAVMLADGLILAGLGIVLLVVCDIVALWINRLPSAASTDLELVWDSAVKATTAQQLMSYPSTAAGIGASFIASSFVAHITAPQVSAVVLAYVLMMVVWYLPTHLPTKPSSAPEESGTRPQVNRPFEDRVRS